MLIKKCFLPFMSMPLLWKPLPTPGLLLSLFWKTATCYYILEVLIFCVCIPLCLQNVFMISIIMIWEPHNLSHWAIGRNIKMRFATCEIPKWTNLLFCIHRVYMCYISALNCIVVTRYMLIWLPHSVVLYMTQSHISVPHSRRCRVIW